MNLLDQALWFALGCFGLGCAAVGFFFGHTVRTERDWQHHLDARTGYRPIASTTGARPAPPTPYRRNLAPGSMHGQATGRMTDPRATGRAHVFAGVGQTVADRTGELADITGQPVQRMS